MYFSCLLSVGHVLGSEEKTGVLAQERTSRSQGRVKYVLRLDREQADLEISRAERKELEALVNTLRAQVLLPSPYRHASERLPSDVAVCERQSVSCLKSQVSRLQSSVLASVTPAVMR